MEKYRPIKYEQKVRPDPIKLSYKHMSDLMFLNYKIASQLLANLHEDILDVLRLGEVPVFYQQLIFSYLQRLYKLATKYKGLTLEKEQYMFFQDFLAKILLTYFPQSEGEEARINPFAPMEEKIETIDELKIFAIPIKEVWARMEIISVLVERVTKDILSYTISEITPRLIEKRLIEILRYAIREKIIDILGYVIAEIPPKVIKKEIT